MRTLIRWLGDQVYVLLISLGWQPRDERGKQEREAPPHP